MRTTKDTLHEKRKAAEEHMNFPPFVRQYDILSNKWGQFTCGRASFSLLPFFVPAVAVRAAGGEGVLAHKGSLPDRRPASYFPK